MHMYMYMLCVCTFVHVVRLHCCAWLHVMRMRMHVQAVVSKCMHHMYMHVTQT